MFFVRIDYIYRGSPVQRVRRLVDTYLHAIDEIGEYHGEDYLVLQVRIEKCV